MPESSPGRESWQSLKERTSPAGTLKITHDPLLCIPSEQLQADNRQNPSETFFLNLEIQIVAWERIRQVGPRAHSRTPDSTTLVVAATPLGKSIRRNINQQRRHRVDPKEILLVLRSSSRFLPRFAAAAVDSRKFIAPEPTNIPGLTLPPALISLKRWVTSPGAMSCALTGVGLGITAFSRSPNPQIPKPRHLALCFGTVLPGQAILRDGILPELPLCSSSFIPRQKRWRLPRTTRQRFPPLILLPKGARHH